MLYVCMFVCLHACGNKPRGCTNECICATQSVILSVCLSVCVSVCLFVRVCVCVSVCLPGEAQGMEEEASTPSDEALNEMISRNEDEFALFQQMDLDRKLADKTWMDEGRKVLTCPCLSNLVLVQLQKPVL